jgi:hypothetical protein
MAQTPLEIQTERAHFTAHGRQIASGTFAASFFLACLAVLERESARLEEI